jgi:uncharacterized membrane protein
MKHEMDAIVPVLMRCLHILSAITLVGGAIVWRLAVVPASQPLAPETRDKFGNAIGAAWRPLVITAVVVLLISGTYNFLRKTGLTPAYHAIFGIKVLLALHVFATAILLVRPNNRKRSRQLTGILISGVAIVVLSAVLRWLSTV